MRENATAIAGSAPGLSTVSLDHIKRSCKDVGAADPGDTQKIASVLLEMSVDYYDDVRKQAQQSFQSALVAAVAGTIFFIVAAALGIYGMIDKATITLVSGGLIQVISAINFYLYAKAARQFSTFHVCLERMNRFLVANSICENLTSTQVRDDTRAELVKVLANAPMLTLEGAAETKSQASSPSIH